MTAADPQLHPSAPVVVPRWEWRTFGDLAGGSELLESVRSVAPQVSDETYVLSRYGDASVKVRAGLMDVKALRHVRGDGLQLWVPTMKADFPVDASSVRSLSTALGVTLTEPDGAPYPWEELEQVLAEHADLRLTAVHKSRHRTVVDDCMVELTELTADGTATYTVAVESPDPALVLETVRRLGLEGRRNTCVARGLKELLDWRADRFAVIDVGTNSVKFHLSGRTETGIATLQDRAVVTRLGEGLAQTGRLSAEAMDRTVDAVAGMAQEARSDGPVDVACVGTAGLRQAPNRDDFVDAVFERCGVAVEVISGPEEARLAYLAAVATLRVTGAALLVFDSGGGSSQFTFGSGRTIEEQFSLDVGAVRFTERYGLSGRVAQDTVQEALAGIAADLDRLRGRTRPDAVVAIGGTSTNLAAVSHGLETYDPDVVHGTVLDVAEIDRQIELYRERDADERRAITGLQPARAEVILAGACIVRTILSLSGQDSVTVSDRGLRHGVAAERFGA